MGQNRPYIQSMPILKIARMGHPVLRAPAAAVPDPSAVEFRRLVADMEETLRDSGGVGLAAPQVHVSSRVVLYQVPAERSGDDEIPLTVLINPVIEPLTDDRTMDWEGCLSLPGMMGAVPRFSHIRLTATDLDGKQFEREAHDYHARVVQHECDHLDGILYPMRMTDLTMFGFVEELSRSTPRGEDMEEAERTENDGT